MARIGSTPFGVGTPATAAALPKRIAVANWVNPTTKDYETDPDTGELAQMPLTRQRVLLALIESYGSSSVRPRDGVSLPRKIGANFRREVTDAVAQALRQLIEVEQVIRLDDVTVDSSGMRAIITVSFTDLTTGQAQSVKVPSAST